MAFNASGLYVAHWIKTAGGTAYANRLLFDLNNATGINYVALYNNTLTISFDGTTGGDYAAYTTTNEASTSTNGYTAGGIAITTAHTPSYALSTGSVARFFHNALTWSASTITAYGAIWYNSAVTAGDTGGVAKPAFVAVSFQQAYTSTNGNFVVTPNASGVFTIDFA